MDLGKFIDYTNVNPTASAEDIRKLCQGAEKYGFYAVCLTPSRVKLSKKFLSGTPIRIVAVIGFPHGTQTTPIKVLEAKEAIKNGADEIDLVINFGFLKDKNYQYVFNDIKSVVKAAQRKTVKVILEVGFLTKREIKRACFLAKKAGADFLKTSTGFGPRGVNPEDIKFIRRIIGRKMGIKAAGGIKTYQKALAMVKAGADRLGVSRGVEIIRGQKRYFK